MDAAKQTLFQIPSQIDVSLREATHNVLILGGIGRGKTTNFILPMLENLIAAGMPGLIVDVKNNLSAKVRRMAAYHGRENDIVELGNRPTATPVNILCGLEREEVKKLFEVTDPPRSGNIDYFDKEGAKIIGDFVDIIYALAKTDMTFAPSLALLAMLVADIEFARKVFEYYREKAYNPDDFDQLAMVSRIKSETFHPLNAKREDDERYHQQVSWNLGRIRQMLAGFASEPYALNFSQASNREFVLNFGELLYRQNKIVLMRFDAGTSGTGRILAKMAKAKLYTDVYRTEPEDIPEGKYTFQVIDEFQDAFEPDGALGDLAWFAKSREYRQINVISCQSMSSLYRGAKPEAVHELVTNCSTKFCLQTEDVATLNYFEKYNLPKRLVDLVGSEAFFCKFDLAQRGMVSALVDVAEIYAQMTEHLGKLARMITPPAQTASEAGIAGQVKEIRITIGFVEKKTEAEKPADEDAAVDSKYEYDGSELLKVFEKAEAKAKAEDDGTTPKISKRMLDYYAQQQEQKIEDYREHWLGQLSAAKRYVLAWTSQPKARPEAPTAPAEPAAAPAPKPEQRAVAMVVLVEEINTANEQDADLHSEAVAAAGPITTKKQ